MFGKRHVIVHGTDPFNAETEAAALATGAITATEAFYVRNHGAVPEAGAWRLCVDGEVERPGKYDLRGETTVTQAVAIAGGVKEHGKYSQAAVFRRLPDGGFEAKTLDLKKMLNEKQLGQDLRLEPHDMIFIPRGRRLKASELTSSLASSLWILTFFH